MEKPLTAILNSPSHKSNLERRFWPKVARLGDEDCWHWTAKARHPFGYGRMSFGRGVNLKAHQIAWALKNGPIPDGKMICHSCDNPSCCNPSHLFLGTQAENMADAKCKGRMCPPPRHFGEKHPNAKLLDSQVSAIANDMRPAAIVAMEYGVSAKTIYCMRRGVGRRSVA